MLTNPARPSLCTCGEIPHDRECPRGIIAGVLYRRFSAVAGIPYRNDVAAEIADALSESAQLRELIAPQEPIPFADTPMGWMHGKIGCALNCLEVGQMSAADGWLTRALKGHEDARDPKVMEIRSEIRTAMGEIRLGRRDDAIRRLEKAFDDSSK